LLVALLPGLKAKWGSGDGDGSSSVRPNTLLATCAYSLIIVEGSLTMFFSIIFVFILPDWPVNTKWLSQEEKALAAARIKADHVGTVQQKMGSWKATLSVLADWRTYLFTFMYMMVVGAGKEVFTSLCLLLILCRHHHLLCADTYFKSRLDWK
jgi:hypothetical protein